MGWFWRFVEWWRKTKEESDWNDAIVIDFGDRFPGQLADLSRTTPQERQALTEALRRRHERPDHTA